MTLPERDDLHRIRFDWPEPLVIELLTEHYGASLPSSMPSAALARQHQAMLRRMVDDVRADRNALRAQLTASLRAAGLDGAVAARGEAAVFFELMRVVGQRFRNSPRLREAYGDRLRAALAEVEPPAPAKARRPVAAPRWRALASVRALPV